MRPFRDASFKNKLVALTSLISIVVAIVACAALIASHAMNYRQELAEDLSSLASVIGNNSAAALLFDDRQSARETLTSLRATPHVRAAYLYNTVGVASAPNRMVTSVPGPPVSFSYGRSNTSTPGATGSWESSAPTSIA